METCISKGMGFKPQRWARFSSMVGRHVGLVSKSNVWMIHRGASEGRHHSWLQPPTCALQVAMEDGVIHLVNTLISPSLHFFRLPSTRLALFQFSIAGYMLSHSLLLDCNTNVSNNGSHKHIGRRGFLSGFLYCRVPCKKKGGIRFTISGNPYFNLVFIWNVGGAGDITSVQVKGDRKLKWTTLKRNWGQNWETDAMLVGESLTFRVRVSDGRYSTSWHIAPKNWQFGQTFEGKNFK